MIAMDWADRAALDFFDWYFRTKRRRPPEQYLKRLADLLRNAREMDKP